MDCKWNICVSTNFLPTFDYPQLFMMRKLTHSVKCVDCIFHLNNYFTVMWIVSGIYVPKIFLQLPDNLWLPSTVHRKKKLTHSAKFMDRMWIIFSQKMKLLSFLINDSNFTLILLLLIVHYEETNLQLKIYGSYVDYKWNLCASNNVLPITKQSLNTINRSLRKKPTYNPNFVDHMWIVFSITKHNQLGILLSLLNFIAKKLNW